MPKRMSRPGAFSAIILRQLDDVCLRARDVVATVMVRADVIEILAGVLQQARRGEGGHKLDGRIDGLHGLAKLGHAFLIRFIAQFVADLPDI